MYSFRVACTATTFAGASNAAAAPTPSALPGNGRYTLVGGGATQWLGLFDPATPGTAFAPPPATVVTLMGAPAAENVASRTELPSAINSNDEAALSDSPQGAIRPADRGVPDVSSPHEPADPVEEVSPLAVPATYWCVTPCPMTRVQVASEDRDPSGVHFQMLYCVRSATNRLPAPSIVAPRNPCHEYALQPDVVHEAHEASVEMHAANFKDGGEALKSTTLRAPTWLVTHRQPADALHGEA